MPEYRAKLYRGHYYAVWIGEDGRTKRAALRTADGEEAQRRLIDFKREMAAPPGALVGEIVRAYLDYKQSRIADPKRLEDGWKQAKPTFGHLRPYQITRELCEAYTARRRNLGRSDATILKEINIIRQALNWGKIKEGLFEAPSAPPPRDRHLTREEFQTLLAGCVQPHVRLFIVLALSTAARKTALLELTWDRVDFERGMIRLAIAGDKYRKGRAVVPMTERARKELTEAKEASQTDYVLEYAGSKIGDIKKGFAAAVKRARLEDVTPHDLRHTAAVWMAEDGVDFNEIAQFLGHSDVRITYRVYARFSPTHLRKAAKSLEF